jgi:hypothetical protein
MPNVIAFMLWLAVSELPQGSHVGAMELRPASLETGLHAPCSRTLKLRGGGLAKRRKTGADSEPEDVSLGGNQDPAALHRCEEIVQAMYCASY